MNENNANQKHAMTNEEEQNAPDSSEHAGAQPTPQAAPQVALDPQAEMEKMREQMLRALADAENTRKRAIKEREDASRYAIASFARNMLDVADNMRRALDAIPADLPQVDARIDSLIEGLKATERGFQTALERGGIRQIYPLDEPFNPNYHEVMMEMPGTGKPAGTVVLVMEAGYILHDRLLRPARVGVAKDEGQGPGPTHPGGHIDTQA